MALNKTRKIDKASSCLSINVSNFVRTDLWKPRDINTELIVVVESFFFASLILIHVMNLRLHFTPVSVIISLFYLTLNDVILYKCDDKNNAG